MRGSAILFLVLTVLLPAAGWLVPGHPLSGLLLPKPLSAQQFTPGDVVLLGRVEDAVSGEPVAGALVMSADSTAAALADFYGPQAFGTSTGPRLTPTVGQVRIYTRQWMAMHAGRRRAMMPVEFGC